MFGSESTTNDPMFPGTALDDGILGDDAGVALLLSPLVSLTARDRLLVSRLYRDRLSGTGAAGRKAVSLVCAAADLNLSDFGRASVVGPWQ